MKAKIACFGNLTFDTTVYGDKFIVEDERNSFDYSTSTPGGPASNAASVIAKFGNPVDFYGRVGNDVYGSFVKNKLEGENIDISYLKESDSVSTPFSFIIINTSDGTRTINTIRSKTDYVNPKIENFEYETDYDFILVDGKYPQDSIELIENNPNAISIIDAGRVNDGVIDVCKRVNFIICSQNFAEGITGGKIDDNDENNANIFRCMQEEFPNANIAITVGKRGYICEKDSDVVTFPAYKPELPVIDTNAAGDIFHGAFTYALANGYDYYQSLEFANVTASLSTTKAGGRYSCPTLTEVEDVLNDEKDNGNNNDYPKVKK